MPEITLDLVAGDRVDVPWSNRSPHHIFHYMRNAVRDPGGNAYLIWFHGGGASGNDARLPFIAPQPGNENGNAIFHAVRNLLTASTDRHWDVFSVQCDQWAYAIGDMPGALDSIGNSHSQTGTLKWGMPPRTNPTSYPANLWQVKEAILAIKTRAAEFGINPDMGGIGGSSYGGWRSTASQITPPLVDVNGQVVSYDTLPKTGPGAYLDQQGVDSRLKFVICYQGQPDERYNPSYVAASAWPNNDVVSPDVQRFKYGKKSTAEWNQIPTAVREYVSLLDWVEKRRLQWLVPHYMLYPDLGPTPAYPLLLSTCHHQVQGINAVNTFKAAGVGHMIALDIPATWSDVDVPLRDATTLKMLEWCSRQLKRQSHMPPEFVPDASAV